MFFIIKLVSSQQTLLIFSGDRKDLTNIETNLIPKTSISRNENYLINSDLTSKAKFKSGFTLKDDQCIFYEEYTSSNGWTQVGSLVEIKNGQAQFIDGAPDGWPNGIQRRLFKKLNNPITDTDLWTASFKFTPLSVGDFGGPFTGHLLFSLTNNSNDPWCDCPDLNCTGYPPGSQDVISVTYMSPNPPNGDLSFYITVRHNYLRYDSPPITYNELGKEIFVVLTKTELNYTLNIYSDSEHNMPLGNGPVSLSVNCLSDFNYIQHGNAIVGYDYRQLTGMLDDVCIALNGKIETKKSTVNYIGCHGDGYSIEINGTKYDESNPVGIENIESASGCNDSLINVNLVFNPIDTNIIFYQGFQNDGYNLTINGTLYNELNPEGTEYLKNIYGCDSIIEIKLKFIPKKTEDCIVFKPNGVLGKDALIINGQGKHKMNFGDDPQMTAMMWNKNDHSGQSTIRSLFQFQLDQIPANAEIISAKLSLYAWDSDDMNGRHDHIFNLYNDCYVKRITENWDEKTVNWFNQPNTTTENQVSLPKPSTGDQDFTDIDVTSIVKDMFKFPQSSYGFMLRLKKEAVFRKVNFSSSDHPDPDKWPELEVCYKIKDNLLIDNRDYTDNNFDFEIYPNPTNNSFYIEVNSKSNVYEIEIYNSSLSLIFKSKNSNTEIDVKKFPKGVYFVKLKNNDSIKIKKLIIQ